MNDPVPINDLDRAIQAMRRSRAAIPEFYRQLAAGDLWLLIPFHPEVEDQTLQLTNGSPLPFAVQSDDQGEMVLLFSSEARVDEGLRNSRVPSGTYSAGSMPARQILEILGKTGVRAILNLTCATGEVMVPPDLMRSLADGSALKAGSPGEEQSHQLDILNAANYPTDLIQPLFEFMRVHREFLAAWVFGKSPDQSAVGKRYLVSILMSPRDERLLHDLNMIAQSAKAKNDVVEIGLLDQTDEAYVQELFSKAPAFYVATDYSGGSEKPAP